MTGLQGKVIQSPPDSGKLGGVNKARIISSDREHVSGQAGQGLSIIRRLSTSQDYQDISAESTVVRGQTTGVRVGNQRNRK